MMYPGYQDWLAHRERYKDLLREAEQYRLSYSAHRHEYHYRRFLQRLLGFTKVTMHEEPKPGSRPFNDAESCCIQGVWKYGETR